MAGDFDMDEFMRQFKRQGAASQDTLTTIKKLMPFILGEFEKGTDILDQAIEEAGPKLKQYLKDAIELGAELDGHALAKYKEAGFTQEEAFELIVIKKRAAISSYQQILATQAKK